MKVALCTIGRMENLYAVEFVEYYKSIGFDKIFIYDNNFGNEEHFEDVLQPYIDDGFVEITNYRNKMVCQLQAYTECYNKHKDEYDWIAFFDFDEFMCVTDGSNVKEYLSDNVFNGFNTIRLNWMNYGDNGLVKYDNRPVQERFTKPADYDIKMTYSFPENNHTKSIIRGGINDFKWRENTHTPGMRLKSCDCNGVQCEDSAFKPYNYDRCYIKHYYTKTIDEWLGHKYTRQYADRPHQKLNIDELVKRFFIFNEKTDEKIKIVEGYKNMAKKGASLVERLNIKLDNEPKVEVTDISYSASTSGNTKDNLDLFIGAYKKFDPPVTNKAYKVIIGNHDVDFDGFPLDVIKCGDKDDVLDDRFYSEQYMLRCLVEDNYPFKEYVGFCHYRKYFSFMDDIPNLDEIFKDYDAIVPRIINNRKTIREQYATCHNVEDLNLVEKIIKEKFPEYAKACDAFIDKNILIPYEMYIMKRDDFIDCIKFINAVLDEYLKEIGTTDIVKHIEENKGKYLKRFAPNNSVDYQYRIGGYLSERITNIFMIHRFKKMKTYQVKITEAKYRNEVGIKKRSEYVKSLIRFDDDGMITEVKKPDGKTYIKVYGGSELVYDGSFNDLIKKIKE